MPNQFDSHKRHRRSIRLRAWDYTTPGAYFLTICTYQRENLFEDSGFRNVVENAWRNIPTQRHAGHVKLDEWVVMPNHLHGILVLFERDEINKSSNRGRGEAARRETSFTTEDADRVASPLRNQSANLKPGTIGAIVGNFKSLSARRVNNLRCTPGAKVWQRGYYDRIVRNDRELNAIRQYIADNPKRWAEDRENLDNLLTRMNKVNEV